MTNVVQTSMNERMIHTNGVEIAAEAFGDPSQSALILIAGGAASMLWWPDEFCRRLASQERFVIRYDHRDTGHSTKYPPGEAPYSISDFAADAIGVLDEYGISGAHFVGMSMGGMIAQVAALEHPARVLSLTAISTTPVGTDTSGLPGSGKEWLEHMTNSHVDWSDRAQTITFLLEDARLSASTVHPFDEAKAKAFLERDFDRGGGYVSAAENHAKLLSEGPRRGRLQDLRVPLLVVHGTSDPVFPFEHGVALSKAVRGAKLIRIEGGGHERHRADWDTIVAALVAHTSSP